MTIVLTGDLAQRHGKNLMFEQMEIPYIDNLHTWDTWDFYNPSLNC